MGALTGEFLRSKNRFLRRKHQISKERQKTRESVVLRFLEFVETKRGIRRIKELTQGDYDNFVKHLREDGLSEETIRNYKGILKEFFARAHLDIKVKPKRSKNAKLERLKRILERRGCADIYDEIARLI